MLKTTLTKGQTATYYFVPEAATVLQFIHDKKLPGADALVKFSETIHVNYLLVNATGETYTDWAGVFSKTSPKDKFTFWANGTPTITKVSAAAAIKDFLRQYEVYEEISGANVEAFVGKLCKDLQKSTSRQTQQQEKKAARRAQTRYLPQISAAAAKQWQKRYDEIYFGDERFLIGINYTNRPDVEMARFTTIALGNKGRHQEHMEGAYVKHGWHGQEYQNPKEENPYYGQWVWVADGVEQPEHNAKTIKQALKKFLTANFNKTEKIENLVETVAETKTAAKLAKNQNPERAV